MDVYVLGTSQSVASATLRERMHVELDEIYDTLECLRNERGILTEAIPLATCGRMELYFVAEDPQKAIRLIRTLISKKTGIARSELEKHSFVIRCHEATLHLLRVAAGLDSVVHGEAQILGQVKDALGHPRAANTAGPLLQRLFQRALTAGKRVRTETEIGRGAASLASASITLLRREAGPLEELNTLVLGAGDTGALMAGLLRKAGVRRMVIANRTLERAENLAASLGATAADLSDLPELLTRADLVIGAVSASERLVTPAMLQTAEREPHGTRYFLDLAHPRNFDPELEKLEDVRVFDLEQIFHRVEAARAQRAAQVPQAEAIVTEEAAEFRRWLRSRGGVSVLRAVRDQVLQLAEAEAVRQSAGRSQAEQEAMRKFARSLARTILHPPTVALRGADPSSSEGRFLLESAAILFGVGDAETEGPS